MAGNKGKGGKGSGSANDQRGGIAKAQESARKGGQDTASSAGSGEKSGGGGTKGGKSGGKS
jgi:hypothetical protein